MPAVPLFRWGGKESESEREICNEYGTLKRRYWWSNSDSTRMTNFITDQQQEYQSEKNSRIISQHKWKMFRPGFAAAYMQDLPRPDITIYK